MKVNPWLFCILQSMLFAPFLNLNPGITEEAKGFFDIIREATERVKRVDKPSPQRLPVPTKQPPIGYSGQRGTVNPCAPAPVVEDNSYRQVIIGDEATAPSVESVPVASTEPPGKAAVLANIRQGQNFNVLTDRIGLPNDTWTYTAKQPNPKQPIEFVAQWRTGRKTGTWNVLLVNAGTANGYNLVVHSVERVQ